MLTNLIMHLTSSLTTAPTLATQIDPSDGIAYYEITDQNQVVVAQVIVTSGAMLRELLPWTEYWKINVPHLSTSDPAYQGLSVKKQAWRVRPLLPFGVDEASFQLPVLVVWTASAQFLDVLRVPGNTGQDCGFAIDVERTSQGWAGTIGFYRAQRIAAFQSLVEAAPVAFSMGRYRSIEFSEARVNP